MLKLIRKIDDILKIKSILRSCGYTAHISDIEWAWRMHSKDYAAQWLGLPEGEGDFNLNVESILDIMFDKLEIEPSET